MMSLSATIASPDQASLPLCTPHLHGAGPTGRSSWMPNWLKSVVRSETSIWKMFQLLINAHATRKIDAPVSSCSGNMTSQNDQTVNLRSSAATGQSFVTPPVPTTNRPNISLIEHFFQPIVRLSTGEIVGFEALIRSQDPRHSSLSAQEIINDLHGYDVLSAVELQCVDQIAAEFRAQLELTGQEYEFSVNFCQALSEDPMLPHFLTSRLDRVGMPYEKFRVEIVETTDIDRNNGAARRNYEKLHALGFKVDIDDLFEGRAGMERMNLPYVSRVKIGRNLTAQYWSDADARRCIAQIIEGARERNLPVVIEGIEEAWQIPTFSFLGCELFQGYFFAKPRSKTTLRHEQSVASRGNISMSPR